MRPRTLCIVALVGLGYAAAQSNSPVSGSTVLTLEGRVSSRKTWGPPGFGETPKVDSRLVIYVLKLGEAKTPKQLSLSENSRELRQDVSEVQLRCDSKALPRCESLLKQSLGRRVTVVGEITEAATPTDFLPVTMFVRLIEKR